VASDLDKPDGLVVVPAGTEREFLAPLEVSRLWGAGAKTQERLRSCGLLTIGDIARMDRALLERTIGEAMGARFHDLANGRDPRRVNPSQGRKSLGKEITFSTDVEDRERVERTLLRLCEGVARGLRKRHMAGRTVHLKLRWEGFETHTRQRTLDEPATTTERIWPVARDMFRELDDPRRRVRLIGVSLSGFDDPPARQLGLFAGEPAAAGGHDDDTDVRVAGAVDRLTEKFGRDAVTRAALLGDRKRT
jgi:nucleotidyltransferase/DNA polymerase involved in DNA repair